MQTIRKTIRVSAAILLAWMTLLAIGQLVLRWTAGIGIPWADIQLRYMVLAIALLGGVIAAADNRHISIDLLEHYLKHPFKGIVKRVIAGLAAFGTSFLTVVSISFIASERQAETVLRGFFFGYNTPMWIVEVIIPVCFGLMTLFFIVSAIHPSPVVEPVQSD